MPQLLSLYFVQCDVLMMMMIMKQGMVAMYVGNEQKCCSSLELFTNVTDLLKE